LFDKEDLYCEKENLIAKLQEHESKVTYEIEENNNQIKDEDGDEENNLDDLPYSDPDGKDYDDDELEIIEPRTKIFVPNQPAEMLASKPKEDPMEIIFTSLLGN